ncbi:hypothetical protein GGP65_003056 [Salinibacter ruber]|nr:hypothetical protein [Salinibacter ruber]MCS3665413.1 hypothetical protein [Salinibacter ruber]MCS4085245.1 hypothetical protein [Salinibacter ruber]
MNWDRFAGSKDTGALILSYVLFSAALLTSPAE